MMKFWICGLGVRGLMTLEDRAGDLGVIIWVELAARVLIGEPERWFAVRGVVGGVEGWFAVREASVKRALVIRFLEGMLFLFLLR